MSVCNDWVKTVLAGGTLMLHRGWLCSLASTSLLIALTLLLPAQTALAAPQSPRQYQAMLFDGVPLELVEVKGLDRPTWVDDLAITVRNTGDKPIYFLDVIAIFSSAEGMNSTLLAAPLHFGDRRLGKASAIPSHDDPAIPIGGTAVLHLSSDQQDTVSTIQDSVKTVIVYLSVISYGDGTGYIGGGPYRDDTTKPRIDPGLLGQRGSSIRRGNRALLMTDPNAMNHSATSEASLRLNKVLSGCPARTPNGLVCSGKYQYDSDFYCWLNCPQDNFLAASMTSSYPCLRFVICPWLCGTHPCDEPVPCDCSRSDCPETCPY